ncbi:MAG: hypothetical protein KDB03_21990 [Planctomycetales bacterium]|nr:hypothetical protein [Planctomycetales bacterium]
MIRIVLLLMASAVGTGLVMGVFNATYGVPLQGENKFPFVNASEDARSSLNVSQEERDELNTETYSNSIVAFSILGAITGAVAAAAGHAYPASGGLVKGLVFGVCLGAVGGAGTGAVAHWYQSSVVLEMDSSLHMIFRLCAASIPLGIGAGIAAALSGKFKRDLANSLAGGLIGILLASVAYGMLNGSVTRLEPEQNIFPVFFENRLSLTIGFIFVTGLLVLMQNSRAATPTKEMAAAAGAE